jgi:hypothetical protein
MSISRNNIPAISLRAKHISQDAVCFIGSFWGEDFVVRAGEEHHWDTFQAAEVGGDSEIAEQGGVVGYEAAVAHLHEKVETGHVDPAEEAVDLSVGGFVQVAMIP